jgi:hypothetical protein
VPELQVFGFTSQYLHHESVAYAKAESVKSSGTMRRVTPKLILGRIVGTDAAHLRDYAFVTMLMIAPEALANYSVFRCAKPAQEPFGL